MAAVVLARRGAVVTACDLSLGYVREVRTRAAAAGVCVELAVCDGTRLPFADGAFERIWGNAILHHLDMSRAAAELWRVLAPGGVAVFCEPWGENRALHWARQALPYRHKSRTADEAPLRRRDLHRLAEQFPGLKVVGHQFLSMLARAIPSRRLAVGLSWCDDLLLRVCPSCQRYCRYVVLRAAK
jgi:SAM-dependent methyltransferase